MTNLKLKYISYSIALQEVPDEISLVINISGCPHLCEGCHSQYLTKYEGNYLLDDLEELINIYYGMITCVCFMGGDQNMIELDTAIEYVHRKGLKTCVYSGSDDFSIFKCSLKYLDWLKIGSYKQELSVDNNIQHGIKLATSNQKLYKRGIDY
ncbi:MAG: Na(+)-translocating NADH-quinone reductase subunit [Clostridiaceae bacterium]|jgi:anaerobic ribonucleoside-triphosphate reductase activating protein|nr:Na(+)-translocating NADH-quinone reductase subunit [Clostridiaceae bacterium]MDF2950471.1 Na(+)-translocating NADH-quinone reductase subunit [Anaerocolumna sp.]